MKSKPLVSIITPSYNQAAFLEQTIRSVLMQDYEPIEYLIVDGASTDGSKEIIERYSNQLAWWVSEPDTGQAEAINKGLKRAQGEIVAWLNSDDLYLPCAIARAVNALQQNPDLGMVYGDAISIDADGRPIHKLTFSDWDLKDLIRFRIICQPTVFMRRSILENAGYLDTSYHFMLDHHLWIRIARLAPIQYLSQLGITHQDIQNQPSTKQLDGFSPLAAARYHPTAKNVAQASDFGRETMLLLNWMQNQSDLATLLSEDKNRVRAGAYRLNGRYLLDGGMPWMALKSYILALKDWPAYTLKHWHRMLFAFLSILKIDRATIPFRRLATMRQRKRLVDQLRQNQLLTSCLNHSIDNNRSGNWPGINLNF